MEIRNEASTIKWRNGYNKKIAVRIGLNVGLYESGDKDRVLPTLFSPILGNDHYNS